jgi:hypothetical protein
MAYQTPKGRVIPWKALYDNNLRQLSRKTVTTPCFGLSPSLKTLRAFSTACNIFESGRAGHPLYQGIGTPWGRV